MPDPQKTGGTGDMPEEAGTPKKSFSIWQWQADARRFYDALWVQLFVASLIVGNFLMFIVAKQIDPFEKKYGDIWLTIDLFFNTIFTLELLVNMYGNWLCGFWKSGWNVFDFVVVAIGLLDTAKVELGPLKLLRMMRAFRVFRLFKKIESLNKIIVSLMHAIPGMMNAFLINAIFMFIFAVLAVDFFGDVGADCRTNPDTRVTITVTSRDGCFGKEYYGDFGKSLYTLFQILTGESWSEAVVRPILLFYDSPFDQFACGMFFTAFIIINAIILLNVVVAVLLDKMSKKEEQADDDEAPAEDKEGPSESDAMKCAATATKEEPAGAKSEGAKSEGAKSESTAAGSVDHAAPNGDGVDLAASASSDVAAMRRELMELRERSDEELKACHKDIAEVREQLALVLALVR
eukprot:TRINITY_DN3159_c0_g1_i1.p1 TRINITY_DN3159_c0_g1~~TRINITY_DN3159_c0_g1_i1.p1  ORF type:complete len:405 (-),score=98.03 TRINITY_DN3159_c0_g1_i1:61-1275(-)